MAHASEDSTGRNVHFLRDPLDKLGAIARHVNARAEELRTLEARLDKRLEHLATTEQNLQKLLEALRRQVAEAHPLIGRLGGARESASRTLDLSQSPSRHSIPTVDPGQIDRLQEIAQQHAANLAAVAYSAQGDLTEHVQHAQQAILSSVAEAEDRVRRCLDALASESEHRVASVTQQIRQSAEAGYNVAAEIRQRLDSEMSDLSRQIEDQIMPFAEQFNLRLARHQQEARLLLDEASQVFHRRMHELDVAVRNSGDMLESRLGEGIVDLRTRAAALMEGVRASLQRDIDQLTLDAKLSVQPVLDSISRQRELAEDRLSTLAASFEQQFRDRKEELTRAGEAAVRRAEEALLRRIDMLRPQAQAAAESADMFLAERLSRMVDNARGLIRNHGDELLAEIEAARASAEKQLRTARDALGREVAELESMASTMIRSLEERLAGRVDELVRKSRRGLQSQLIEMSRRDSQQMLQLDAAQEMVLQSLPAAQMIIAPDPIRLEAPVDPPKVDIFYTERAQRVA
jgi:ABC-type transporter Mla subunit MlaD